MWNVIVSIAFDGLAYAMILFIISVGLSVTMGLMGFVNLAHGVFAMLGGYLAVSFMRLWECPFLLAAGYQQQPVSWHQSTYAPGRTKVPG